MKISNWPRYTKFEVISLNDWTEEKESKGWEIINFFLDHREFGNDGYKVLIGLCKLNIKQIHQNWHK